MRRNHPIGSFCGETRFPFAPIHRLRLHYLSRLKTGNNRYRLLRALTFSQFRNLVYVEDEQHNDLARVCRAV